MAHRALSNAARQPFMAPAALLLAAAALSGCGTWFGEEEVILQGERVALRQAAAAASTTGATAAVGPTQSVRGWPQAGGASNRTVGNASGDVALSRVWSTSIGAGSDSESRITAPPVAASGRIYALDAAAQVTAVSEKDGARVWQVELEPEDEDGRDGFGGGLALIGDFLIAATGFGEVIGLRAATGERLWTYQVGSPVRSAPTVSDGLAVVVARDGSLIALEVGSGAERWRVVGLEGGASMLTGGGASPAISGEVVAAPFSSGDISIFRLRDGRQGWSQPLGAARRGSAMSLISDVSSSPVIAGGRVFAGSVSGRLVSFDIRSGRRVWARDIGAYNPVLVSGPTVFAVSEDARLIAMSAQNGSTIWELELPRFDDPDDREDPFAYGGPVMAGGKLFVVSSDEKAFRVDGASGALEMEIDIPGPAAAPPITLNGRLIILDDDGDLHSYE